MGLSRGTIFTLQTISGVIVGLGLGFALRQLHFPWAKREAMYLKMVGDLFLRALGGLVAPLIVSSLIDAVGSLDFSTSKKIGAKALIFYMSTTSLAAVLGVTLAVIIRPGVGGSITEVCPTSESATVDVLLDLVRNMFPNNILGAFLEASKTTVDNSNLTIPYDQRDFTVGVEKGTNMMGLVIFSIVLGFTIGKLGEGGQSLLTFFKALGSATMFIMTRIVRFSPVAICFLIAGQLVTQGDVASTFRNMGWYGFTVILGLCIHGLITLPLAYMVLTKEGAKGTFDFFNNMGEAVATAFGTASSSATLPVTLRCLEEKNGVDPNVSRFIIPIGATVNMDGTSLYLPIATIYLAQVCGRSLGFGELVTVVLVAIATSVGAAGIPQVGMIILMTILTSVGLPVHLISFVLPLDWLLERFRTCVNILGDSVGAGIVAKTESIKDKSPAEIALLTVNPTQPVAS